MATVLLLNDTSNLQHRLASLVEQFHSMRNRDWDVTIHHIYREANNAADYLANLGHDFVLGIDVIPILDNALLYWLRYDLIGVALPRLINNNS
ncbi:Putative ribonuclease H protein At1g65750 [Linum perenne]